jgi:hypothetical protein
MTKKSNLKAVSVPFQCSGSDYSDPHNFCGLPGTGFVINSADLNPDHSINKQKKFVKTLFLQYCDFLTTCYLCRPMYSKCTRKELIRFKFKSLLQARKLDWLDVIT